MACVLTDFERGRIVGARQAGASIAQTAELVEVSTTTVCRIMTEFLKGKTAADKSSCGRKKKLDERQRRHLKRLVLNDRRLSAVKIKAAVNATLNNPISTHTVRRELHGQNLYARAAIAKPLIKKANAEKRLRWCQERKSWTLEQWRKIVYSDESTYTLFPTAGRIYVWRTPKEAYNPECLRPTVKHGGGSIMIWGAISWSSVGPVMALKGKVKAGDYETVLGDKVCLSILLSFDFSTTIFFYRFYR